MTAAPSIGERYRGVEGRSGFLLRQAWLELRAAVETALREQGMTPTAYGALSVLVRDAPMSGADLARATSTTAQAMNGVLATLEREGLIERHPHPTHGRVREVFLTNEGQRRVKAATRVVRKLETRIEKGFTAEQLATIKEWLVTAAQRMEKRH
jgi:DNA-binding MarR family transcriptional regulator